MKTTVGTTALFNKGDVIAALKLHFNLPADAVITFPGMAGFDNFVVANWETRPSDLAGRQ